MQIMIDLPPDLEQDLIHQSAKFNAPLQTSNLYFASSTPNDSSFHFSVVRGYIVLWRNLWLPSFWVLSWQTPTAPWSGSTDWKLAILGGLRILGSLSQNDRYFTARLQGDRFHLQCDCSGRLDWPRNPTNSASQYDRKTAKIFKSATSTNYGYCQLSINANHPRKWRSP